MAIVGDERETMHIYDFNAVLTWGLLTIYVILTFSIKNWFFFFIDMGYCFVNCQFICLFYVKMYLFVFKLTRSSWNIEKYEFKNHIKPDLINQEWYQNLIELVGNTVYVNNSIDKLK